MTTMTEIYGEVISSYSRAQAIEDGVLVDVSNVATAPNGGIFKFPVAITTAVHAMIARGAGKKIETYNARLHDVLHMAVLAAKADPDVFFRVKVGARNLDLWANCGPGDDARPVITIGFPSDR